MGREDRAAGSSRLAGVDIARGAAILGMLWVHFAPDGTGSALPDGRSAILFATLAGVSLGLLTGGARPPSRGRLSACRTVAIRGLVLIVLGRLLVLLGTPIAVILDYYGVLFLLLLVVLFANRVVLALVVVLAVSAGAALIQAAGPDPSAAFLDPDPWHWPEQWLLTGIYPVALYAAFVAAGLIAARSDLGRRRTQLAMIGVGAVLAPIGYLMGGALGVDAGPHANTTWEAIGSGGVAIAVIGGLQLAVGLRAVRVLLSPVADMGAMPLTVYTGQVVAAALFLRTQPTAAQSLISYWWLLAAMVGGSLLFAVVWRRLAGRGPMEQVLATLSLAGGLPSAPRNSRSDGATPSAVRVRRAVLVGLVSGGLGAAAVLGSSALIPTATNPSVRASSGAAPDHSLNSATGTVRLKLDSAVLAQAAVTTGAAGAGRAIDSVIALPVTDGQVMWSADQVAGAVVAEGSGFTLTRGATVVRLSNLVIDLEGGTGAGDVTVNGKSVAKEALVLQLAPTTPRPASAAADGVAVRGLRLRVSDTTAALIDHALNSPVFAAAKTLGTASVTVSGTSSN